MDKVGEKREGKNWIATVTQFGTGQAIRPLKPSAGRLPQSGRRSPVLQLADLLVCVTKNRSVILHKPSKYLHISACCV